MINDLTVKTGKYCYEDIARNIKKIKLDNDDDIIFYEYIDYKYNFNNNKFIFVENKIITMKEENIVKEVIECITRLITKD